jgi:hypothetical protein
LLDRARCGCPSTLALYGSIAIKWVDGDSDGKEVRFTQDALESSKRLQVLDICNAGFCVARTDKARSDEKLKEHFATLSPLGSK